MSTVRTPSRMPTPVGTDPAGGIVVLAGLAITGIVCLRAFSFLTAVWSGLGNLSAVLMIESVLVTALVGLAIGWLRRGLHVRKGFGISLLSALLTKDFFRETPLRVCAQLLVQFATGYAVGVMLAAGDAHLSRDRYLTTMGLLVWSGGSGGGPEEEVGFIGLIFALLGILAVAAAVGALVMVVADQLSVWLILKFAGTGASHGAVKEFMTVLAERSEVDWGALRDGALKGALTGVIAGVVLLAYPEPFGVRLLYVTPSVRAGEEARLVASTGQGAACWGAVSFGSSQRKLARTVADDKGRVGWAWRTPANGAVGMRRLVITCTDGQRTERLESTFRLVL